jgi:hypothetical protein
MGSPSSGRADARTAADLSDGNDGDAGVLLCSPVPGAGSVAILLSGVTASSFASSSPNPAVAVPAPSPSAGVDNDADAVGAHAAGMAACIRVLLGETDQQAMCQRRGL